MKPLLEVFTITVLWISQVFGATILSKNDGWDQLRLEQSILAADENQPPITAMGRLPTNFQKDHLLRPKDGPQDEVQRITQTGQQNNSKTKLKVQLRAEKREDTQMLQDNRQTEFENRIGIVGKEKEQPHTTLERPQIVKFDQSETDFGSDQATDLAELQKPPSLWTRMKSGSGWAQKIKESKSFGSLKKLPSSVARSLSVKNLPKGMASCVNSFKAKVGRTASRPGNDGKSTWTPWKKKRSRKSAASPYSPDWGSDDEEKGIRSKYAKDLDYNFKKQRVPSPTRSPPSERQDSERHRSSQQDFDDIEETTQPRNGKYPNLDNERYRTLEQNVDDNFEETKRPSPTRSPVSEKLDHDRLMFLKQEFDENEKTKPSTNGKLPTRPPSSESLNERYRSPKHDSGAPDIGSEGADVAPERKKPRFTSDWRSSLTSSKEPEAKRTLSFPNADWRSSYPSFNPPNRTPSADMGASGTGLLSKFREGELKSAFDQAARISQRGRREERTLPSSPRDAGEVKSSDIPYSQHANLNPRVKRELFDSLPPQKRGQ